MYRDRSTDNLRSTQSSLREMKDIAKADGNGLLAYLLEMAYIEASDILRAAHAADSANAGKPVAMSGRRRLYAVGGSSYR